MRVNWNLRFTKLRSKKPRLDKIAKVIFFLRPQHPPVAFSPVQSFSDPRLKATQSETQLHSKLPSESAIDASTMSNGSTQQNLTVPEVNASNQLVSIEASHHITPLIPNPIGIHAPVPANNTSAITSPTTQLRLSYNVSRLLKLNMPSFAGDPLLWQSFWHCFDAAINSNPMLTGVQKLTYLRAQLQGDTAGVIAGFPLPDANYSHSIGLLQNLFGQPYKLSSAHMQALLDLPSPTNTLTSLQHFHDSVESHIKSLSSLGKDRESYGDLLIPIIRGKLPVVTRKNFARNHSNSEWRLNELQDAILKEIHILETGLNIVNQHKQNPSTPAASFHTNAGRNPCPTDDS